MAIYEGSPPTIFELLYKAQIIRNFDDFFGDSLNNLLNKQPYCRWFETLWRTCCVIWMWNLIKTILYESSNYPSCTIFFPIYPQPINPNMMDIIYVVHRHAHIDSMAYGDWCRNRQFPDNAHYINAMLIFHFIFVFRTGRILEFAIVALYLTM